MELYMSFEHKGRKYKLFHDMEYETRGSYACNTEEETKAAEDEELANLRSGKWVVLYAVVYSYCIYCQRWNDTDSVGGCVIENNKDKAREYIIDSLGD